MPFQSSVNSLLFRLPQPLLFTTEVEKCKCPRSLVLYSSDVLSFCQSTSYTTHIFLPLWPPFFFFRPVKKSEPKNFRQMKESQKRKLLWENDLIFATWFCSHFALLVVKFQMYKTTSSVFHILQWAGVQLVFGYIKELLCKKEPSGWDWWASKEEDEAGGRKPKLTASATGQLWKTVLLT